MEATSMLICAVFLQAVQCRGGGREAAGGKERYTGALVLGLSPSSI
jgi:hypothetical protein